MQILGLLLFLNTSNTPETRSRNFYNKLEQVFLRRILTTVVASCGTNLWRIELCSAQKRLVQEKNVLKKARMPDMQVSCASRLLQISCANF